MERWKRVLLAIFQSFPGPWHTVLKAGQGQEKGIWGNLPSLFKAEMVSRTLPGVSKISYLVICYFSCFPISLLSSLCCLFSSSLLVLLQNACPTDLPISSQRLTCCPSMPEEGQFSSGQVQNCVTWVSNMVFVSIFWPFFWPLPELLRCIYNQRLGFKASGKCWHFRPSKLMPLFM